MAPFSIILVGEFCVTIYTLTKACKLIGIEMVDHLVISASSYYSFADERTEKFNKKS